MVHKSNSETQPGDLSQLVIAAQAGDRSAFGELFVRYRSAIFAVAMRRLRNSSEAQELCQDVFVQALQKIEQLRKPECFGGWLKSITHRMAINRVVRRKGMISTDPELINSLTSVNASPVGHAMQNEQAAEVRQGLDRLGDLDRVTLEAFYLRGCSLNQMSQEFDAPLGTIKRRLHTARHRLSKQVHTPA